jgi:hypothetical protein
MRADHCSTADGLWMLDLQIFFGIVERAWGRIVLETLWLILVISTFAKRRPFGISSAAADLWHQAAGKMGMVCLSVGEIQACSHHVEQFDHVFRAISLRPAGNARDERNMR